MVRIMSVGNEELLVEKAREKRERLTERERERVCVYVYMLIHKHRPFGMPTFFTKT